MKVIFKISDCKMKHSKLGCKKSQVIFLKLGGKFMLTVAYPDISRCQYTGYWVPKLCLQIKETLMENNINYLISSMQKHHLRH